MLTKLSLLTVCSALLLSVNAQSDCPDVSLACNSNPCEDGARCPRFYNADCTVNTCNGGCTPNFFFRGRNVTDRCETVTCDTRKCPPRRQCMEEVTPSVCPSQRNCRQILRARCVLRPRPMSCEDIECGEGMMCRMRDRGNRPPVVRCIPAPPTNPPPTTTEQSTTVASTEPTTLPITTIITPLTTNTIPTSTPTSPPATCQGVTCPPGQECIEFPTDGSITGFSGPMCFNVIRPSCDDLSCAATEECLTQSFPAVDLTVSACVAESVLEFVNGTFSCNESLCVSENSACTVYTHPRIVTSSLCVSGISEIVRLVNLIFSQINSTTSPPGTTGTTPTATTGTPFTTPFTITSSTPTPTSSPATCQGVTCGLGQECIEFPTDGSITGVSGPTCINVLRPSCDDLSCPAGDMCITQTLLEADLTIATCLQESIIQSLNGLFTCNESSCPGEDSGCVLITHLSVEIASICIPNGFNQQVLLVNFILSQLNSTTSPPGTTGTTPTATPFTTPFTVGVTTTTTSTPTPTSPPTSCGSVSCGFGQECIEFPADGSIGGFSGPTCFVAVRLSCEDLSCPASTECITQTLLEADLTIAVCAAESFIPSINGSFTCNESSCPGEDSGCVVITHLSIETASICLPSGFNQSVLLTNFILSQLNSTSTPTPTSSPNSCEGITCEPGQECIEFPTDGSITGFSGPTCFNTFRRSCEDLSCPAGDVCITQTLLEADLTIATCLQESLLQSLNGFFTCNESICPGENSGCVVITHPSIETASICLRSRFNETVLRINFILSQLSSTTSPPSTTGTTPFTIGVSTTTSATPTPTSPPTSCGSVSCGLGQDCIEFPADGSIGGFSGPTCFFAVRLSCEDLSCPASTVCVTQTLLEADLTVAVCAAESSIPSINGSFTCNESSCPGEDSGCIVTTHLSVEITSICLPSGFNQTVLLVDFILSQLNSTTSPPGTTGTTPTATTGTPFTTPFTITSSTPTPTSSPVTCQGVTCLPRQECIEFPTDGSIAGFSGPTCFPAVRLSCEDLSCPANEVCITQTLLEADLTIAICVVESFTLPVNGSLTCNESSCPGEDSGCVLITHPSIEAVSFCVPSGFNQTVLVVNFILSQLNLTTSPPGTTPTATPFTTPFTIGVTTNQPSNSTPTPTSSPNGCDSLNCGPNLECFDFPSDISPAMCIPRLGLSCDSLSCPSGQVCAVQSLPTENISIAVCTQSGLFDIMESTTCDSQSCDGDDTGCSELMHSNVTLAFCLSGFSNTILIARHLIMVLTDQAVSTALPPTTEIVTSSPVTNIFSTFSTTPSVPTTDSPLCSMDCSSIGQQCVGLSAEGTGNGNPVTGVCLPIIGLNCEDITCPNMPEEHSCILQSFAERDIQIAQCIPSSSLNFTLFQATSCAVVQCEQGSVCVDLRIGDRQVMGTCIPTGCTDGTTCSLEAGNTCSLVPPELGLNISSVCVPSFVQSQFGTQTCEMIGRTCPSSLVCQEAYLNDELISTLCNTNPFPSSCDEISCSDNEECVLTSSATSTLASCVANIDAILPTIQQLLELLGLVDTSNTDSPPTTPTRTELFTTLSTIAPPTTTTLECPFNCSIIGQVCVNETGFLTCVQPSTCTEELSAFCSQTRRICQESDGEALCVPVSSCDQLVCPSQLECVELSSNPATPNSTIATCIDTSQFGRSCEDVACNETTSGCLITELPTRNLTVAQCLPENNLTPFSVSTCENIECTEGSVCIDLERRGLPVMGSCLVSGCEQNDTCPLGTVCTLIPSEFGLQVDSVCVPSTVNPLVGTQTCAESGRVCPNSFDTCQEALIDGTLVGTSCSSSAQVISSTCQNLLCDEGEDCVLSRVEGFGSTLQSCVPMEFIDQTVRVVEQIFT